MLQIKEKVNNTTSNSPPSHFPPLLHVTNLFMPPGICTLSSPKHHCYYPKDHLGVVTKDGDPAQKLSAWQERSSLQQRLPCGYRKGYRRHETLFRPVLPPQSQTAEAANCGGSCSHEIAFSTRKTCHSLQ